MKFLYLTLPLALLLTACDKAPQAGTATDTSLSAQAVEKTDAAWQTAKQESGRVMDKAAEAGQATVADAKQAYRDIKEGTTDAYHDLKDGAGQAYDATKEAAKDAYRSAEYHAKSTWQAVKEKVDDR